jgi:hypothetical protein
MIFGDITPMGARIFRVGLYVAEWAIKGNNRMIAKIKN